MARKPHRTTAKVHVYSHVEEPAATALKRAAAARSTEFRSVSQLVETILFWLRAGWLERGDQVLVREIVRVNAITKIYRADYRAAPKTAFVHLTVDEEAAGFLEFFAREHPGAFASKDDALNQICVYSASKLERALEREQFIKSLEEVMRLNP